MRASIVLAAGLMTLACASPALATVRYAEPDSAAPHGGSPCAQSDPCGLEDAADFIDVNDGDEVVVLPGDYTLGSTISVADDIELHGENGQPRPSLTSTAPTALDAAHPGGVVRHLEIEHSGVLSAVDARGGTVEDVISHTTSANGYACGTSSTVRLRDSVCWNTAASGSGGGIGLNTSGGTHAITLRNVTAVATGTGSHGITMSGGGIPASITVDAKSVVARGQLWDVRANADTTSSAVINLDHSNYETTNAFASGSGTATITDPTTNSNQTDAPMFADASNGDFHQIAGSPTINSGEVDTSSGSTDFDGEPRTQGTAPDIGADEFDGLAPDTDVTGDLPVLTNDSTPTFSFSSTEAGSTFECSIDQGTPSFSPCSSPGPGTTGSHTPAGGLGDGAYTFRVRARDAADNADSSPATHDFTVDATPPNTTITSGPAEGTTISDSTPTFGFSANEAGSSFECSVDGGSFGACTSPTTTAALSKGQHTFQARATDQAANTDPTPASRGFTVDTTTSPPPPRPPIDDDPPETTITKGPKAKTKSRSAGFEFSSDEAGSSFECSLDGGDFTACDSPFTRKVKRKRHSFEVRAIDAAGNADQTPAQHGWKVKKKKKKK